MNHNKGDDNLSCYLHPRRLAVGVCSLCLKEKLIVLASKQEYQCTSFRSQKKKIAAVAGIIPKIFRLSSFPTLFDLHRPNQVENPSSSSPSFSHGDSIFSLEDSFISIKFDGGKRSKKEDRMMVEHGKQLPVLRWPDRIRCVFRLAQWTWPNKKGRKCHVGVGVEG